MFTVYFWYLSFAQNTGLFIVSKAGLSLMLCYSSIPQELCFMV